MKAGTIAEDMKGMATITTGTEDMTGMTTIMTDISNQVWGAVKWCNAGNLLMKVAVEKKEYPVKVVKKRGMNE